MVRGVTRSIAGGSAPTCHTFEVERANVAPRTVTGSARWQSFEDTLCRFVMDTPLPPVDTSPDELVLRVWVQGRALTRGWETLVDALPVPVRASQARDVEVLREAIRLASDVAPASKERFDVDRLALLVYWRWAGQGAPEDDADFYPYPDALQRRGAKALCDSMRVMHPEEDPLTTSVMLMVGLAANDARRGGECAALHPVLLHVCLPLACYNATPEFAVADGAARVGADEVSDFLLPMGTRGLALARPSRALHVEASQHHGEEPSERPAHMHLSPHEDADFNNKLMRVYDLSGPPNANERAPSDAQPDREGRRKCGGLLLAQAATLSGALFLWTLDPNPHSDDGDPEFGLFAQVRYDAYRNERAVALQREDQSALWVAMGQAASARGRDEGEEKPQKKSRSKHVGRATEIWTTGLRNLETHFSALTLASVTCNPLELVGGVKEEPGDSPETSSCACVSTVPTRTAPGAGETVQQEQQREGTPLHRAVDHVLSHANVLQLHLERAMASHPATDRRASEDAAAGHTHLLVAAVAAWAAAQHAGTSLRAESLVRTAAARIHDIHDWRCFGTINAAACVFRVDA